MNFKKLFNSRINSHYFSMVDSNYISDKNTDSPLIDTSSDSDTCPNSVFSDLNDNLSTMKSMYNTLINSDIILREFSCNFNGMKYNAFIIFFDGMSDATLINNFLLKPLMQNQKIPLPKKQNKLLEDYITDSLIPENAVKKVSSFSEIAKSINSGNCILFVDTINIAFDVDVKGYKQRSVDTPQNEVIIKGPHEAFVENLRTNTSLLRRSANTENLIIESIEIGKISKTKCAICYMQNITNGDLISEVKYRLNNIDIESLISSGQLEQLIEESNTFGIPQILSTERPDKCTKFLFEGRVVILVNGNPYALIMPVTLMDFLISSEDSNLRPTFTNFLRFLRLLSFAITLLLPGIYIAITSFHQELIPSELLFSILTSRENVPFPIIFELLLMEISFEIIREAGLRIPSPIGSTLSIVGGLIIGDAAVTANVVSPILVIVVAITGIASFAIPDFSFGFHLRIFRFIFIILGFSTGFIGIGVGLFAYISILCNINSFGVPFTSPYTPATFDSNIGYVMVPTWKHNNRLSYLATQRRNRQSQYSKKWEQK